MYFRRLLFTQGYRYSLNSGKIPGHPDIYLRKYNAAIFIHGCFWHRHLGCRYAYLSKSRIEFWQKNKSATYKPSLDHSKSINEMNLKKKTKSIITMIYLNYLCDDEERDNMNLILKDNEEKYQQELREKYNSKIKFK